MELLLSVIVLLLCLSARLASAGTTHVFVYDAQAQQQDTKQSRDVSITEARLILAQRAGVDDYHDLGFESRSSDDVARAINDYGTQKSLFGQDKNTNRAFVLVEDWSLPLEDLTESLHNYGHFTVPASPASNETGGLFIDIARQADPSIFDGLEESSIPTHLAKSLHQNRNGDLYHSMRSVETRRGLFQKLAASGMFDVTVTITTIDESSYESGTTPRWGTYEMPNAKSFLRKRNQREVPLESDFKPVESFSAPVSSLADNSEPLPGILPACFPSLSACQTTTRNCTGHGTCGLKYVNQDAQSQSPSKNCYACQCSATTVQNDRGKKTTQWGGPACQKKDVSMPFWLLFLFTIAMLSLVGFAIGQVWSMGNEELPSVIGAGVSGPVRR